MSREHITLYALQALIKSRLESAMPTTIWVCAEVADIKVNSSGHCYLDLVEKGEGETTPRAHVRATIWRSAYASLSARFKASTGGEIMRGMKVLVSAKVSYHPTFGLTLQISAIDPSYTLGDLERIKRETIARLQNEGVWELNRKRTMPYVPQRIAVISSANAAGYEDFISQLNSSCYRFDLTLFSSPMQGEGVESGVITALDQIAAQAHNFDAVVIIRGGGSTTDLRWFDNYAICAAVARFPLPVLSGIGHERDESIVDMVAHTPLKTPTAVAVWLTERLEKIDGWLENAALKITKEAQQSIHKSELLLKQWSVELHVESSKLTEREAIKLTTQGEQLDHLIHTMLQRERERLDSLTAMVDSHSPKHILTKGFSIARINGKAVSTIDDVTIGQRLEVTVSDGTVAAEVVEKQVIT